MKKWLPYVVAAVLGVGVAVVAFGPGMSGDGKEKPAKQAKREGRDGKAEKKSVTQKDMGADGFDITHVEGETRTPAEIVAEAKANPPPPPGTLRPMNEAEIKHEARLARPFNQHYAYVASFWNQAARLVGPADSDISRECSAMARYLRDQGNLNEELDVAAAIAKEQALIAKVRSSAPGNSELDAVLNYIQASSQAVLDGNDPTAVPKPGK
jgi:hypothetical protein